MELVCASAALGQAVPTFVGVRTFLGAPYITNLDNVHADFAVLGVPFDEGTWGWPGERYGPRACARALRNTITTLPRAFTMSTGIAPFSKANTGWMSGTFR